MVQHALDFGQRERWVFMPQAMQDNDAQVVDANRDFQQAGIDASLFAPEVRQVALSITEGGNVQAQGVWLIEDEGTRGSSCFVPCYATFSEKHVMSEHRGRGLRLNGRVLFVHKKITAETWPGRTDPAWAGTGPLRARTSISRGSLGGLRILSALKG